MNNFLLYLQMTSNLVNFTSCSTSGSSASTSEAAEVNNNNNDKCTLETSFSSRKDDEHNEEPTIQPQSHSVYTLNDDRRILVHSPEEWLCVARLPLDFTQTEFESLLQDFGPLHTCFLIHSEISGRFKIPPCPTLPLYYHPPILMINYYSNIQMKFGEEEVEHVEKTTTIYYSKKFTKQSVKQSLLWWTWCTRCRTT